jgi:hypothetical protein
MPKRIRLQLTAPQKQFVMSEAMHPGMVAGYGAGKSQAAVARIALRACKYPGMAFGFVEPTHDLVRLIAWPRFGEMLTTWGVGHELNKSESIMRLENGSQIIFRSADAPERLVGFEIADGVIDEADTLKAAHAADVWTKMLGRCRQRKPDGSSNTLAAVSTPEGFAWMYQTFGRELKPGYELIRAPTWSNPYLPKGYVDQLRATYNPQQLEAYLNGEFVNLTAGSVYAEFDRNLNASRESIQDREAVHIGLDFNVTNMAAAVSVFRGDTVHFVEELTGIRDTPAMIAILKDRYKDRGHAVHVYPDASGGATKSVNAALSDIVLLRAAGIQVWANSRNPAIRDRVASVNGLIHNQGKRRLFVRADKCPTLIENLEQQAYDKHGQPDKSTGMDHLNDAAGYLVAYKFPIHRGPVKMATVTGM